MTMQRGDWSWLILFARVRPPPDEKRQEVANMQTLSVESAANIHIRKQRRGMLGRVYTNRVDTLVMHGSNLQTDSEVAIGVDTVQIRQ
jgi:hypothetical protein